MRLKFLLLLVVSFALICDVALAAKDRKKNKNKQKHEDPTEDDEERRVGGGLSVTEDKRKETKDRVKDLIEREEERKERHEKKEESSEEKDDKKGEKNSTEIIIPKGRFRRHHHQKIEHLLQRQRREHSLKKTSEINDGQQTALETKPQQDHQCGPNCEHRKRTRRQQSLSKAEEVNDGEQTPLGVRPKQNHECKSIRCSHKRSTEDEQVADEDMMTEKEVPKISLVRTRRAKGGKKDIGHRLATHPHGNKRNGIKAGRRRGTNTGGKPRGNKDKASKKSKRHVPLVEEEESREEPSQNEQNLDELIKSRLYGDHSTFGRHLVRRKYRSVTHEELDHKKEHKKYPQNSDATVVSADAATITEI